MERGDACAQERSTIVNEVHHHPPTASSEQCFQDAMRHVLTSDATQIGNAGGERCIEYTRPAHREVERGYRHLLNGVLK